jgi:regulatory protein
VDDEKKPKKTLTPSQALLKAQASCAYQERCQQEMRDKLYEWGLYSDAVENIIADLITDNFLNEERFAKSYAGGKFRIKKWGKIKIKIELKKRKISEYCIKRAMQEISDNEYFATIQQLIAKKSKEIKGGKPQIRNYKIVQYIASKGFEQSLIWDALSSSLPEGRGNS